MFKVGQKVCRAAVVGTIEILDDGDTSFPLGVRLPDGDIEWFTIDGRDWENEPVVLSVIEEPKDVNMHLSPDSMNKILKLISEGWEFMISYGDHKSWTDITSPNWEVDFTRRTEDGTRYDNHESGYSLNINEAVDVAYSNIRNGVKLKAWRD